jgi:hypothetical protein
MLGIYCKKEPRSNLEMDSGVYSGLVDRFRIINRHAVNEIFVDETLIQIDGHNYWLWVAYEPNLDTCLMMHLSRRKGPFSYVTSSSSSYVIGIW